MGRRTGYVPSAAERLRARAAKLGVSAAVLLEMDEAGLLRCCGCRSWRPRGCFGANRSRASGRQAECLGCCAERRKVA
jgi:hypothetical protein